MVSMQTQTSWPTLKCSPRLLGPFQMARVSFFCITHFSSNVLMYILTLRYVDKIMPLILVNIIHDYNNNTIII